MSMPVVIKQDTNIYDSIVTMFLSDVGSVFIIDENENLSDEYGIRRIPTLIFFKDGKEVGNRLVEPKSKTQIIEEIEKIK